MASLNHHFHKVLGMEHNMDISASPRSELCVSISLANPAWELGRRANSTGEDNPCSLQLSCTTAFQQQRINKLPLPLWSVENCKYPRS